MKVFEYIWGIYVCIIAIISWVIVYVLTFGTIRDVLNDWRKE